jgi:protein TonB
MHSAPLLLAALVKLRHPCARNRITASLLLARAAEDAALSLAEREACLSLIDDLEQDTQSASMMQEDLARRPDAKRLSCWIPMTAMRLKWPPSGMRPSPSLLAAVALAHGGLLTVLLAAPVPPVPAMLARPLTVSLIESATEAPLPSAEPRPAPPVAKPAAPVLAAERPLPAAAPQPVAEIAEAAPEPVAETTLPAPAEAASEPAPAPLAPPRSVDYRTNPKPLYPPLSRRLGEAGTVHLDILVNPDGSVARLVLAKSSGHPRLDRTAIETVQSSWKFEPARQGGRPVAAWVTVPIQFTLRS